jgi:cell wall assembly regulator SMI1
VKSLIEELDKHLATNRPELYTTLRPSADEAGLDALQAILPVRLPPLFHALYQWRDGQVQDTRERFWDVWFLLPLEEVCRCKEMLDAMIGHDFERPDWWCRGWVPFLGNRNGDHVCLDLTAETGGAPGQLLNFWHDWEDRGLTSFDLEWWVQGLIRPHDLLSVLQRSSRRSG